MAVKSGNPSHTAFEYSKKPWGEQGYSRETFIHDLKKVSKKKEPDDRLAGGKA